MSYNIMLPSSCPEASKRPDGSIHTDAKALPVKEIKRFEHL
jgi:hypothetical protein